MPEVEDVEDVEDVDDVPVVALEVEPPAPPLGSTEASPPHPCESTNTGAMKRRTTKARMNLR